MVSDKLQAYCSNAFTAGYREADLRLCFRICKKPVFSQRGSYFLDEQDE